MTSRHISVCIPVYNESENIRMAVETIERVFREKLPGYTLELVVTDNASTDQTWETVKQMAEARPHLRAFRFSRNFGYQNSVFAGLCLAGGDAVVEVDADLEDPPEVIPEFVKQWEAGYEVVYGVRRKRHTSPLLKLPIYIFYRFLNSMVERPIPNDAGDFRLLDRKVVEVLRELPERNLYLRGLVSFVGFRQIGLPYDRNPRLAGKSKFRLFHYIVLAIDAVTAFSKFPLRLIGLLGVLFFVLTAGLGFYYLIAAFFFGVDVRGFTTQVVLTLFLHSLTFIFLGIIGEYLSRIFDDSKFRPRVIISETVNAGEGRRML
ncbi:MAG: glycosyltransferase family 2 protein [Verrucomicrobiae bacterium]|nr:glycosyltransferase family 2 protein [Verrucomicrobiae bacterium]